MSKLSFQYGFSVFLMTPVVLVCSPLTVATANGSGKPVRCCQSPPWLSLAPTSRTEYISLVESICRNDCPKMLAHPFWLLPHDPRSCVLVTLKFAAVGSSMTPLLLPLGNALFCDQGTIQRRRYCIRCRDGDVVWKAKDEVRYVSVVVRMASARGL